MAMFHAMQNEKKAAMNGQKLSGFEGGIEDHTCGTMREQTPYLS